jgi:hypothetical protein
VVYMESRRRALDFVSYRRVLCDSIRGDVDRAGRVYPIQPVQVVPQSVLAFASELQVHCDKIRAAANEARPVRYSWSALMIVPR